MRNIAIFVSGEGAAAERIVKLFNEGNRLKTVLVVTDDSGSEIIDRLKDEDVTCLHIPDTEWPEKQSDVAELIKDKEVKLLVLDNFDLMISSEIMEAVDGNLLRISTPEQAPREVVAALEADLRKPAEEKPTVEENPDTPPTLESEWADTLKINFTPPKVNTNPPPLPDSESQMPDGTYNQDFPRNQYNQESPSNQFNQGNQPYRFPPRQENRQQYPDEPMPSTWLIWSVIVTVICCFIPGIIAIIFSSQVSSRYYAGDVEGARRASHMAEIWIIVSVVLGIISATLYFPFMLIGW